MRTIIFVSFIAANTLTFAAEKKTVSKPFISDFFIDYDYKIPHSSISNIASSQNDNKIDKLENDLFWNRELFNSVSMGE